MTNPCKKTGGWVHLAEAGEYVYGDIFEAAPGVYYVRVMHKIEGNRIFEMPEKGEVWARFDKITSTHCSGDIETIHGLGNMLFEWQWTADPGEGPVKVALS